MIKWIIVGIAGYIVYRAAKSKAKTILFGLRNSKEIKAAADLIPCEQCGSFTERTTAVVGSKKSFCSEECRQLYRKEDR